MDFEERQQLNRISKEGLCVSRTVTIAVWSVSVHGLLSVHGTCKAGVARNNLEKPFFNVYSSEQQTTAESFDTKYVNSIVERRAFFDALIDIVLIWKAPDFHCIKPYI